MFTPRRQQPETAPRETASPASNTGYMAELEQWLDEAIFEPIEDAIATNDAKDLHLAFTQAKQLLKRRVLASYHNGLRTKAPNINRNDNGQQTYRRN